MEDGTAREDDGGKQILVPSGRWLADREEIVHPVAEADEPSPIGRLTIEEFYTRHGVAHSSSTFNPRGLCNFIQCWIPSGGAPVLGIVASSGAGAGGDAPPGRPRGIGRAIATHLASLGASLVLGYASSSKQADALAAELPRAVAVRADVSDEAGVRSLFDAAESAFGDDGGAAHILVACAGVAVGTYPSLADTATEDFDAAFAVNPYPSLFDWRRGRSSSSPSGRGRRGQRQRAWSRAARPRDRWEKQM